MTARARLVSRLAAGLAAGLALALCLPPGARAEDRADDSAALCGAKPTQLAMNDCAGAAFRTADDALNRRWSEVMARMDDPARREEIRAAQRAWLGYRDLACRAEAGVYAGGSIAPMIHSLCLERLTRIRTSDLDAFLQ